MECLYLPSLSDNKADIIITGEELRHLIVLRLKEGENILITNGNGLCVIASLKSINKKNASFTAQEFFINSGELKYHLGLAIGILDNNERLEFALEKSIELGISDFYPLNTEFSQKKTIHKSRLEKKAISALKQSKRSCLTIIHTPITITQLIQNNPNYDTILLADYSGIQPDFSESYKSTLIFVGPEGGFSEKEIGLINKQKNSQSINIANRRLRAETAAILTVGLVALKMKE